MITVRLSNIKKFLFFLLIIILSGSINFANAQPLGTFTFPNNPSIFPGPVTFLGGVVGVVGGIPVTNVQFSPYNAKGDGVTNDGAAIQAAINAAGDGGTVYFPNGTYKLTGASTCHITVGVAGQNISLIGQNRYKTIIDASSCPSGNTILDVPYQAHSFLMRNLTLTAGASNSTTNMKGLLTECCSLSDGFVILDNVQIDYFIPNSAYINSRHCSINNSWFSSTGTGIGLQVNSSDCSVINVYTSGLQIGGPGTGSNHVHVEHSEMDDHSPNSVYIFGNDNTISNSYVYTNSAGVGIRIGDGTAAPARTLITNTLIGPFSTGYAELWNVLISANVTDTVLNNVSTQVQNSGGDISDSGTNTRFINVTRNGTFGSSGGTYNWIQQGTSVMGTTEKLGTGAGNYTTASASYVDIDNTNLKNIAVVPVGWKESCNFVASADSSTLAAVLGVAIADGNVVKKEQTLTQAVASDFEPISVQHSVLGDGASHTITAQWKVSAGTATIANSTATLLPNLSCTLMPFS